MPARKECLQCLRFLMQSLYLQLSRPWASAPPASTWGPRKPPFRTEWLPLPAPMRPQEQLVPYCLGLRAQEQGLCYRVSRS